MPASLRASSRSSAPMKQSPPPSLIGPGAGGRFDAVNAVPRPQHSDPSEAEERWRRYAPVLVRHEANLSLVAATFERLGLQREAAAARRLRVVAAGALNELAQRADGRGILP